MILSREFKELSATELYQILALRNEVFVVEQNCIYQDLDNYDQQAIHFYLKKEKGMVAYARYFAPNIKYKNTASIGRVVVSKNFRGENLGKKIVKACIEHSIKNYKEVPITISAQSHLEKFYTELGFLSTGKKYLEDGIPHIEMIFN